jgi:peptidoglycan/LPS O-acetylase OafA/YrhL
VTDLSAHRWRPSTIGSLQAGRAVAALMVVLYHASGSIFAKYFASRPAGRVFDFGYAGVDFFFVLSGFIMMHVHGDDFGKPALLGKYLWKRATRIYLPYWAVLLAIVPVFVVVPQFGSGHELEPSVLLTSVLLVPHAGSSYLLVVAWTLVFELFFYLLFASLIMNRRLGLCIFAVWIGLLVTRYGSSRFPGSFLADFYHVRFLAGMGIAILLQRYRLPSPRVWAVLGTVVFVCTGAIDVYDGPLGIYGRTAGYTAGSVLVIAGLVAAERAGAVRVPRPLTFLGDASYAIYLVHFPTLSLLAKCFKAARLDSSMPGGVLFVALVSAAVGVSCAFYLCVERPLMSWAKRRLSRRAGARTMEASPPTDQASEEVGRAA